MAVNSFNAQNPPVTTKGDLFTFSTIPTRLAIGATNGHVLQVDSTASTGMKWAAAPSTGASFSLLNSGGTTLSGTTTTVSGISGQEQLWVFVDGGSAGATAEFYLRLNTDTGSNYGYATTANLSADTWNKYQNDFERSYFTDRFPIGRTASNAADILHSGSLIQGCAGTGTKLIISSGGGVSGTGSSQKQFTGTGIYTGSSAITSISIFCSSTMDAGKVYVYGSAN